MLDMAEQLTMPLDRTNTTISCIVTNAQLTKAHATKVAQMAADAYAHTIRPTHTSNDGDTIYILASGELDEETSAAIPIDLLGLMATRRSRRLSSPDAPRPRGCMACRPTAISPLHNRRPCGMIWQ